MHAHVAECEGCRTERESLHLVVSSPQRVERAGTTRALALLSRPGVLRSISVTVLGQAAARVIEVARAGFARVVGLPTRVCWLLPLLLTPSVQAAASSIGRVRLMGARFARQVLAAGRVGAMRILNVLLRVIGTMGDVGRIVVTTSGRALFHIAARASALRERKAVGWTRPRPLLSLLRVCAGIVGLAVLVAATVWLWPRQEPDNLVDRQPAALDVSAPVARTPAPGSVSAPRAAPVEVARSETPRATMRPRPIEAQDEIPAPARRPDPTLAQRRTTAYTRLPSTEATQNAEASDPTAAIDWLLKGGSSR